MGTESSPYCQAPPSSARRAITPAIAPQVLPHPYAFNVFSHNDAVDLDSGYNGEEMKVMAETRRILGSGDVDEIWRIALHAGVISEQEFALVERRNALRDKVIRVDVPILGDVGHVLEDLLHIWKARGRKVNKAGLVDILGAAGAEVGRSSFTRTVCRWGSAMGKICATRTSTQVLRMSSFARSHIPSRTPGIRRDGTSTWTCR